jgi:hypothetical protein
MVQRYQILRLERPAVHTTAPEVSNCRWKKMLSTFWERKFESRGRFLETKFALEFESVYLGM